jgi:hypothetical protein
MKTRASKGTSNQTPAQRVAKGSTRGTSETLDLSHPLFNRSERRLCEIVDVCMGSHDGMPLLNVLLSRVPTIGEEVAVEARIYRVIGVQHSTLDLDGRAAFGTHAHLTVVEVPDEGYLHRPERPVAQRTRRKKPRGNPAPE